MFHFRLQDPPPIIARATNNTCLRPPPIGPPPVPRNQQPPSARVRVLPSPPPTQPTQAPSLGKQASRRTDSAKPLPPRACWPVQPPHRHLLLQSGGLIRRGPVSAAGSVASIARSLKVLKRAASVMFPAAIFGKFEGGVAPRQSIERRKRGDW
ncbi:uncharacterized protein BKA78DRAFT_328744 [Phyllosticta capitalensis]|uniref:uncharacterized protein n=1 Tax=Phyllosticta capitalensis TaxID=121624 RepID=UPI00312F7C5B